MSSAQESGAQEQPGGSASGGSSDTAPRNPTRFETLGDAHRCITGQSSSDLTERDLLPDPSVHEDDGHEEKSQDITTLEEKQRLEQDWFDQTFLAISANDDPPSGEEIPVSAGEETEKSSGFNQALLVGTVTSNRSASIYRAAPDLIRRSGAVGRIGFRDESSGVETVSAQTHAQADSDGPSLPLPADPPGHRAQTDNIVFPDPSVSSVTNSQALLQGTLSSPPARTFQPGHRANRLNISSITSAVPRRNSRREPSLSTGNNRSGTQGQVTPFYAIAEGEEWIGPGPTLVGGVMMDVHARDPNAPVPNVRQSTLAVPQEVASASTTRTNSAAPESSGSSGRDPFHYDHIFLPSEQERVVTSRLRTMTGNATVFSQSPLNSPERPEEYHEIPLDSGSETPSRPSSSRRQQTTTAPEIQVQRDNGPYAPSPSYHMDSRGVRVAGQDSEDPTFYIGNSPEGYSSTERIIAVSDQHAVTGSPTRQTRALQRSDFSTFRPVQRNHRVNGRDENPLGIINVDQPRQRRPTLETYQTAPAAYLGSVARNRGRFEFRDSIGDAPEQAGHADNWHGLPTDPDMTATAQSIEPDHRANNQDINETDRRNPAVSSPYSTDPTPSTFGQFSFALLPLDEARRRQAEARSRGEMDQTFISASTVTRRTRNSSVLASSSNLMARGRRPFSSLLAQAERAQQRASDFIQGSRQRRRAITHTTGQRDSFSSVMRVGIEEHRTNPGAGATPHAFLPGEITPSASAGASAAGAGAGAGNNAAPPPPPPTLHPPPRLFLGSSRFGNIRDEDIELAPYGVPGAVAADVRPGTTALGRRWSS